MNNINKQNLILRTYQCRDSKGQDYGEFIGTTPNLAAQKALDKILKINPEYKTNSREINFQLLETTKKVPLIDTKPYLYNHRMKEVSKDLASMKTQKPVSILEFKGKGQLKMIPKLDQVLVNVSEEDPDIKHSKKADSVADELRSIIVGL